MKVFVVGDIIGSPGRDILKAYLDKHVEEFDFVIINGENSSGGFGITEKVVEDFYNMGVDVITSGNHVWDKKEGYELIKDDNRILRPLNYPRGVIGRGFGIFNTKSGDKLAVVNLQGRIFMNEIDSPFERLRAELENIRKETNKIIIDFHAEATSEKIAMAWYVDGEVSLVYGTHTHVQTADERVLTKGTGFISDVGMTGGFDGIIGMKKEAVIEKFLTCMPRKFEVCAENVRLNGIIAEISNATGVCIKIERVNLGMSDIK